MARIEVTPPCRLLPPVVEVQARPEGGPVALGDVGLVEPRAAVGDVDDPVPGDRAAAGSRSGSPIRAMNSGVGVGRELEPVVGVDAARPASGDRLPGLPVEEPDLAVELGDQVERPAVAERSR